MTVTETVSPVFDRRDYNEVENGVGLWYANGIITGVGSGDAKLTVQFNSALNTNPKLYVAVTRIGITSAGVNHSTGGNNARSFFAADHWERTSGASSASVPIAPLELVQGESNTDYQASFFGFVNAGRLEGATAGEVSVILADDASLSAVVHLEGIHSQHPLAGRWWLSA